MDMRLVRTVEPHHFASPWGWAEALLAERHGLGPLWQRGDGAFPVIMGSDVAFLMADAWQVTPAGRRLDRNSVAFVDTTAGHVYVTRSAPVLWPEAGRWWWPSGGIATGTVEFLAFGTVWAEGPLYGTPEQPAVARLSLAPEDPAALYRVGLEAPGVVRWGTPVRIGDTVYVPGYDGTPWVWRHWLGRHAFSADPNDYGAGWTIQPLTVEAPPLAPLTLMEYGGGVLATAKRLPSGPELDYRESPEVTAWWAPVPEGNYVHLDAVVADTTSPQYRSYAGFVADLPFCGHCAIWSRNALPGAVPDPDGYGPQFLRPVLPSLAELAKITEA